MAVHFLLAEDSPRRCVSERESPVGQPEKESERGDYRRKVLLLPLFHSPQPGGGGKTKPARKKEERRLQVGGRKEERKGQRGTTEANQEGRGKSLWCMPQIDMQSKIIILDQPKNIPTKMVLYNKCFLTFVNFQSIWS